MIELHDLLKRHGFRFPERCAVEGADDAVRVSARLGYPVVLKGEAPDILHKTELGLVALDLRTESDVRHAHERITLQLSCHSTGVTTGQIVVEQSRPSDVEVLLGIERNPQFGLTVTLGMGGVLAELLSDVQVRTVPLSRADALDMIRSLRGHRLLAGFRGKHPISQEMLVQLVLSAASLAQEAEEVLGSIDLNPIALVGDEHWVLDTKGVWDEAQERLPEEGANAEGLNVFFSPRSVAVIGATETRGKIGHAILDSLLSGEYGGTVFPVNPRRDQVLGLRCYPSIESLPSSPDLAVAAVSLNLLPAVIEQCGEKGIRGLVVVSGGGKETGERGQAIEEDMARLARSLGVRVIGPNCIGVFDGQTRFDTFFQPRDQMLRPLPGPLAILSQSGTVAASLLEQAETIGVSKMVSYGNRLDVDEADLITFLGEDEATRVIACYIEGAADGRGLLEAIRAVAETKPIVIFKAARSPAGASGAASHTGFFGGTYSVWEGALRQAGAILVDSVEELFAAVNGLVRQPMTAGRRVAMIGNGAGPMVQALDLLSGQGLELASLETSTEARLRERFAPPFVIGNPLDLTGSATAEDYESGLREVLGDPGVDAVMIWFVFQDASLDESIVERLARISAEADKPIVCGATGGVYTARMAAAVEANGIPVLSTVREWVAATRALCGKPLRA